jgi:hypothetical protein
MTAKAGPKIGRVHKLARIAAATVGAAMVPDLARLALALTGLARLRDANPELFDGASAIASVRASIADYDEYERNRTHDA